MMTTAIFNGNENEHENFQTQKQFFILCKKIGKIVICDMPEIETIFVNEY